MRHSFFGKLAFTTLMLLSVTISLSIQANAQTNQQANHVQDNSQTVGNYTINYTAFNSQFVPADIAKIHGLVRAKDQALINISVLDKKTGKTVPAIITGTAKNLIQQTKNLTFTTINEPDAIYYIAALRHSNEELFHFAITVDINGTAHTLKFIRKLYTEQ